MKGDHLMLNRGAGQVDFDPAIAENGALRSRSRPRSAGGSASSFFTRIAVVSMALASLSNVEKHFGKQVLFEKLDLAIFEGERVGFIGANGAGKSTLFRMLTGEIEPDQGTVAVGRNYKVGYLR